MELHPSSNISEAYKATHPTITSIKMPQDHTLIIEANTTNSQAENSNKKLKNMYVIGLLQVVGMQML